METFAGFAEHTDYEIGRLVKAIEDMGELDNTLFFYIVGDNGASAEGGPNGMYNEMTYFNGIVGDGPEHAEAHRRVGRARDLPALRGRLGGGRQHAVPVDQAGRLPLRRHAQRAGDHWPKGIKAKGEMRSQFHHVIDVAPTVLEAANIPQPKTVNGVDAAPMDGVCMVYTFDDAKAAGPPHDAVLRDVRQPRASTTTAGSPPPCTRRRGRSQPRHSSTKTCGSSTTSTRTSAKPTDLAATNPAKLKELQALFMKEAERNHVLPIDDRSLERFDPAIAGRPDLMAGRKSLTVYEGMTGMMENAFINVKNQSLTITAEVEIPAGDANGVIIAQGGRFGGWSLYVKDGKPAYTYNFVGLQQYTVNAHRTARARQGDHHAGLRLRRQRPRQGRHRHALDQRQEGGIGTHRADQRQHLLGGRCGRRGH